jgi:phenylalanyl-tRNA synthetase beta chain
MSRDVAFLVDETLDTGAVLSALKEACGELASDIYIFDVYKGKGVDEGKKSLAFGIKYRSYKKTLTDKEVDAVHNSAVNAVCARFAITTR